MKRFVLFFVLPAFLTGTAQSIQNSELRIKNCESPDRTPAEWSSVQTNAIAKWKTENKAPQGVVADKTSRSVKFLAEATGVREGDAVEFLAIGPLSDRAYESLLVSVATPEAIARACDDAGIPRGCAADQFAARLWPYGEKVSVTVRAVSSPSAEGMSFLIRDLREQDDGAVLASPAVWTAGSRDASGMPVANTNMPCAIFALYNHAPSLLQLDGAFDQSGTYGRFVSAASRKRGELFEVTAAWDGKVHVKDIVLKLNAANAASQISALRETSKNTDAYVRLAFDADVTVKQAASVAGAFDLLDGKGIKMNGTADGQFYFRAFLPDPAWRERAGRIFQPFEIHVAADGKKTFVFCEEDWSGEGLDPVLKPHSEPFTEWNELPALIAKTGEQGTKVTVAFLFAPESTPVSALTPVISATGRRIGTYYVFAE